MHITTRVTIQMKGGGLKTLHMRCRALYIFTISKFCGSLSKLRVPKNGNPLSIIGSKSRVRSRSSLGRGAAGLREAHIVRVCVFVPTFWRQTSVSTELSVHPMPARGVFLFFFLEAFPWHQMSSKQVEKNGREMKSASERDVICLQSIGCTSDHSWEPAIICFHLPAYFHFSPFLFLIPLLSIFLF